MRVNKSPNKYRYTGSAHGDVRRMILESLEVYVQRKLRRIIDVRREKVSLELFKEAHERAKKVVSTAIFKVIELVAVKAFFFRAADEIIEKKSTILPGPRISTKVSSATS